MGAERQLQPNTVALFKRMLRRLKPTEKISLAEWADKYRRLPSESSSEPGQWKTSRTPYLKRPMECISDPKVREVVMMTSAQVGKSEVLLNAMGYCVDIDPSPTLIVQPTVEMGLDFSKERIAPTIRDTPVLRAKIGSEKSRDAKNTILKKYFAGGYIAIVGANSPVGLAARPVKKLFLDEIDRFPESARKEGDPVTIVQKRTTTYPYNHKIAKFSTPTIDGASRIQHDYNRGTMEKWNLPCPGCDELHELKWANIVIPKDSEGEYDPEGEVLHTCESCGLLSNEIEWKNGEGEWVALNPNPNAKVVSFQLSALSSPWKSWASIVEEFIDAQSDTEMLKVWVNTVMGETWIEDGESVDHIELYSRREAYKALVPNGVLVITAGVDVQDDRFELEIVGWGENKVSWGIEYVILHGDTSLPETWDRLDQYLLRRYVCEDGTALPIERTAVDSGHRTTEVYRFCKAREMRGVYAIKGMGGPGMSIVHNITKTKKVKNSLFIIAVDAVKSILFSRLALQDTDKAGYCHFPTDDKYERGYDEKYFEGLTSETKITKMVKGRPKTEWKLKTGVRNEPLDCRVYNTAALEILNPNFEQLKNRKNAPVRPKRRRGVVSKGVDA